MLKDIIEIASGFQTSVNIAYDMRQTRKIEGFIPTTSAFELIDNILCSTEDTSTQRAKILTGAYGRGKSHIMLVTLAMLSKNCSKKTFSEIIRKMGNYNSDAAKRAKNYIDSKKKLLPVIITGSSTNLTQAFMSALQRTLSEYNLEDIMPDTHFQAAESMIKIWKEKFPSTYKKFENNIDGTARAFIKSLKEHDTIAYQKFIELYPELTSGSSFNPFVGFDVTTIYEKVNSALKSKGYSGMYVVYDEFGKYMEASIATASESETRLLQNFAEMCCRSGEQQMHIMLIGHKEISNYIDSSLPKDKVDGWRGISGRFEHIMLHNNFSQMYEIIEAVIEKDERPWQRFVKQNSDKFNELSDRFGKDKLINNNDIITGCYPLHPVTTFALPRLSEKVAQNERTLFTFLSANQKNTLAQLVENDTSDFTLVTPDYLYDYFESEFRKEKDSSEVFQVYRLAMTVLKNVTKGSLHSKIIKAIAVIYIIGQFEKLAPTVDTITSIFVDLVENPSEIADAIDYLVKNACVVYVKRSNNYLKLKESSGIDVREQIDNRIEQLKTHVSTEQILNKLSFDNYIYPVKYNDEHCITRYFEFVFSNANNYDQNVGFGRDSAGRIIGVFFDTKSDFNKFKKKIPAENNQIIFIVPTEYFEISELAFEYYAILELREENLDNSVLTDEYDIYIDDISTLVFDFVNNYTRPEKHKSHYYHSGKLQKITRKAQLSQLLSNICYDVFPLSPVINNESLNKNLLPGVAINSRNKVVNALLESEEIQENLGLSGTGQDVSFMRSSLIQTGILSFKNECWNLNLTPDDDNICNLLNTISAFFESTIKNGETSFEELYDELTLSEHGIGLKRGVIPIFIAVVLHNIKNDIVIKHNGKEVRITADLLNGINEMPANYTVVAEHWNADKKAFLADLGRIFSSNIIEQERSYNSFVYIANAMNRWCASLPKFAKDMKRNYETGKPLDKSHIDFINSLRLPIENPREFLIEKLPRIFKTKFKELSEKIEEAKSEFDDAGISISRAVHQTISSCFNGDDKFNLSITVGEWYKSLKRPTLEYVFPNSENAILDTISNASNNDFEFMNALGQAITGLRLGDWNNETFDSFKMLLESFKDTIEKYDRDANVSEIHKSDYKLIVRGEDGNETVKSFDKIEYSKRGKLLYNDITGAIEEMGKSISEQEKRQILVEILEKLCK